VKFFLLCFAGDEGTGHALELDTQVVLGNTCLPSMASGV
jgi:hypothetical protein